jgi:acetoin utilization protein AcuB
MTKNPLTVEASTSIADAQKMMRDKNIRHLPVTDDGKLVGVVSDRDLNWTQTLREVDPSSVTVDASMTPDPYTVAPDAALVHVAEQMWKNKYGSVVVLDGDKIVGMFTTVDGMRALFEHLNK